MFAGTQHRMWREGDKEIVRQFFEKELANHRLSITKDRSKECQTLLANKGIHVTVQAVRCIAMRLRREGYGKFSTTPFTEEKT